MAFPALSPARSATWVLPIRHEGVYEVFIWYPEASNRITDAPFTVHYSGGAMSQTTRVNQQLNGGVWLSLGQFSFAGNNPQERLVLIQI